MIRTILRGLALWVLISCGSDESATTYHGTTNCGYGNNDVWDLGDPNVVLGFILVEAGSFTMGSPDYEPGREYGESQHQVTLTRDFWMMQNEVTQKIWAVSPRNPSMFTGCGNDCPVDSVTWWEALHYANFYSDALGYPECYVIEGCNDVMIGEGRQCTNVTLQNGQGEPIDTPYECEGFRLPTEAEWEYAYRAGTDTAFHNGAITEVGQDPVDANLEQIGWFAGNCEVAYEGAFSGTFNGMMTTLETVENCGTHPVGLKEPNAWGFHDMAGNVSEWIWDRSQPGTLQEGDGIDPVGSGGSAFILRGGSWSHFASEARASSRQYMTMGTPGGDIGNRPSSYGFRLVRTDFQ